MADHQFVGFHMMCPLLRIYALSSLSPMPQELLSPKTQQTGSHKAAIISGQLTVYMDESGGKA